MVSEAVVLDTGPLGLVTNPKRSQQSVACTQWLQSLITARVRVILPEIADYEVRRELLRARRMGGLARLDELAHRLEYLSINTEAMRHAARLWAEARQRGQPTAPDHALDGDVILAAQAITLGITDFIVATTNVGHLSRYVAAERWQDITAE